MFDHSGRVAVVTGAGRGVGRAHAIMLASRGCAVVVNDLGANPDGRGVDTGPADEVVETIRAAGGRPVAFYGSVAARENANAMVETALSGSAVSTP